MMLSIFLWANSEKLPLGFPSDWVYESAFGAGYQDAIKSRTEDSPLTHLVDVDIDAEKRSSCKTS